MDQPHFNAEKFKALVHYVCRSCHDPAKLGAVKLHKILWFSDSTSYVQVGDSITGETYIKHQYGPFAQDLGNAVDALVSEGRLFVREVDFHGQQKKEFIAKGAADPSFMSDAERRVVDRFIKQVCEDHSAESISERTHNQIWKTARMFEPIPYESLLVNFVQPTEEDLEWARGEIERIENG